MKKLPVTVRSGFLRGGNTTLLNHVLANRAGRRVAVIVHDLNEVNIDARLMKAGDAGLSRTEAQSVEMTNGCICRTLREDLLIEVSRLVRENRFDYLLIESTDISEPLPVAETFPFEDAGSLELVSDLFARREDGFPLLTAQDESTVVPGLFLCGLISLRPGGAARQPRLLFHLQVPTTVRGGRQSDHDSVGPAGRRARTVPPEGHVCGRFDVLRWRGCLLGNQKATGDR